MSRPRRAQANGSDPVCSQSLLSPPRRRRAARGNEPGCKPTVPLNHHVSFGGCPPADTRSKSPSPPFRGEREGPAQREGEVGGAANRIVGPPHPALSPRPAGGEG